mgnify:CR=1 FL=1
MFRRQSILGRCITITYALDKFGVDTTWSTVKMAEALLNQAHGYGIIIGLSILFCLIILAAVRVQKRYLAEDSEQSEMFMVANRSVGTGLTASAVFSSW